MKPLPLPQHLTKRLQAAQKFAVALLPGATKINYIDALALTPMRWHMFQVYRDGQYGILQYQDQSGRFSLEFPYKLVLGQYNSYPDVVVDH